MTADSNSHFNFRPLRKKTQKTQKFREDPKKNLEKKHYEHKNILLFWTLCVENAVIFVRELLTIETYPGYAHSGRS